MDAFILDLNVRNNGADVQMQIPVDFISIGDVQRCFSDAYRCFCGTDCGFVNVFADSVMGNE